MLKRSGEAAGCSFLPNSHRSPPIGGRTAARSAHASGVRWSGYWAARAVYLIGLCTAVCGCATPPSAHYVYQDGEFGVIGIPRNTFLEKTDYRAKAEVLMARHFPEGHEIVRAEEVIEGQRTLDLGNKTEIDANPAFTALNQRIKLGTLGRTTSYEEKDQLQLRECRIIYKRKPACTPGRSGQFAAIALLTPRLYVDPNEAVRHQPSTQTLAKVDPACKPASDPRGL